MCKREFNESRLVLAVVLVLLGLVLLGAVFAWAQVGGTPEAATLKATISPPDPDHVPNTDIRLDGCELVSVDAREVPPFWIRLVAYCPGRLSTAWLKTESALGATVSVRPGDGPVIGGAVLGPRNGQ